MCVVQYACMQTAPTDLQWLLPILIFAGLIFALFSFSVKYAKMRPPRKKRALKIMLTYQSCDMKIGKISFSRQLVIAVDPLDHTSPYCNQLVYPRICCPRYSQGTCQETLSYFFTAIIIHTLKINKVIMCKLVAIILFYI